MGSNWPISWFPRLILSFTVLQFISIVIYLAAVAGYKATNPFHDFLDQFLPSLSFNSLPSIVVSLAAPTGWIASNHGMGCLLSLD
jgi:hypothetical protein